MNVRLSNLQCRGGVERTGREKDHTFCGMPFQHAVEYCTRFDEHGTYASRTHAANDGACDFQRLYLAHGGHKWTAGRPKNMRIYIRTLTGHAHIRSQRKRRGRSRGGSYEKHVSAWRRWPFNWSCTLTLGPGFGTANPQRSATLP